MTTETNEQLKRRIRRKREWMRIAAHEFRQSLSPGMFNGTQERYNENMKRAMQHLQIAMTWRDEARDLAKLIT